MKENAPIMDKALLNMENPEDIEKYFTDQTRFHFAKLNVETIDDFNGDFGFLNNEYESEVYYEGLVYPNVYTAFQASRSTNDFVRKQISEAKSAYEVYSLSQQIEDPKDWPSRRLKVMEMLARDKFTRHADMKQELITTGSRLLVNSYAHETPSNLFWGKVKGSGFNYLGTILMNIREEVFKNQNLLLWMYSNINLPEFKQLYPEFKIRLSFENQLIKIDALEAKSYYFIGSSKSDDMVISDPEVDRKAIVIAFDTKKGLVIVKTSANCDVTIKDKAIEYLIPTSIKNKSTIRIGSKVSLQVECNVQKIQDYLQKRQNDMEYELKALKSQADNPNTQELVLASYGVSEDKTLFVTGFKLISEGELRDTFKVFGGIESIRIPIDKYTGRSRGFAFVRFDSPSSAQMALKTPLYHSGEKLIVKLADKRSSEMNKEVEKSVDDRKRNRKDSRRRPVSKSSSRSVSSITSISSDSSQSDDSSLSSSESRSKRHRKKRY